MVCQPKKPAIAAGHAAGQICRERLGILELEVKNYSFDVVLAGFSLSFASTKAKRHMKATEDSSQVSPERGDPLSARFRRQNLRCVKNLIANAKGCMLTFFA